MPKRAPTHSKGKRVDYDSPHLLSPRELQVLKLVVDGHTSSEAGSLLGLSPKSVDTYRSRIMVKLRLENLAGLVKFAIRHGVTTLEYRARASVTAVRQSVKNRAR